MDSTVFINAWTKHYPRDVFPCVWECITELLHDGHAFIPAAVYGDIKKHSDDLFKWVKEHKKYVQNETPEIILIQKQIANSHSRLLKGGRSGSDPWVIAHAKVGNVALVSDEDRGSEKNPKIPEVCTALNVPLLKTVEMLKDYQFSV